MCSPGGYDIDGTHLDIGQASYANGLHPAKACFFRAHARLQSLREVPFA